MDVDRDEEVLQALAQGEAMKYEQWPELLSRLIPRLEKIVSEDFPTPSVSSQTIPSSQDTASPSQPETETQTSFNDKENAPPPPSTITLPPQILILIESITSTLNSLFSTHPPHTIQRLAELLLNPTQHYRTLPSYLHALDRVVHVSSGAHIFPLPPAIPDPSAATVLSNGVLTSGADPLSISWGNPSNTPLTGPGSDESLGGALLTPISWLTKPTNGSSSTPQSPEIRSESTEMIDGPNGPGGVETVSISVNGVSSAKESDAETVANLRAEGGVTQGELLRQEQRAGVVPAAQLRDGEEEEEMPHARGPEEIGAEDIGVQEVGHVGHGMQGIDVEAAVGRKIVVEEREDVKLEEGNRTPKREAESEEGGDEKRVKEDEDMEITDADGEVVKDGEDEKDEKKEEVKSEEVA